MDTRISTLESDVAAVRAKVEVIHSNYATNDALLEAKNELNLKIVESHNSLDRKIDRVAAEQDGKRETIASALSLKMETIAAAQNLKMESLAAAQNLKTDTAVSELHLRMEQLSNEHNVQIIALDRKIDKLGSDLCSEMAQKSISLRNWFLVTVLSLFVGLGAAANLMYNVLRS